MLGSAQRQVNSREWWKSLKLVGNELRLGSNHADLLDASGKDRVPELQSQPTSSNDVTFDGTATPGATIDRHSLRRFANAVEPSAPNQEVPIAERPERIERIPRCNHHAVARAQVSLSDFLKGSRMVGNCFQGLRNGGQVSIPEVDVAPL